MGRAEEPRALLTLLPARPAKWAGLAVSGGVWYKIKALLVLQWLHTELLLLSNKDVAIYLNLHIYMISAPLGTYTFIYAASSPWPHKTFLLSSISLTMPIYIYKTITYNE